MSSNFIHHFVLYHIILLIIKFYRSSPISQLLSTYSTIDIWSIDIWSIDIWSIDIWSTDINFVSYLLILLIIKIYCSSPMSQLLNTYSTKIDYSINQSTIGQMMSYSNVRLAKKTLRRSNVCWPNGFRPKDG